MSNKEINPENENFELFGTPAEDNLKEVLARGAYKWTNKTTGVLAIFLLVVSSASAGAWYGHRQAGSGVSSAASTARAFAGFRNGGGASGLASGLPGGTTGGFGGGNFPGGRGTSATITSVKGNSVTLTVENLSSSNLASAKAGDKVTVRASNGGGNGFGAGGAAQPLVAPSSGASASTSGKKSKKSGSTTTPSGKPTLGAATSPQDGGGQGGGGQGGGGGGGQGGARGAFNNPEFTACLKDQGVTIAPGSRPDRSDTKVAAALQACFSKLGISGPGGGNGGGAPRPAPTSTP